MYVARELSELLLSQGKNRPLDEDELEFLDNIANATAEQERAVAEQEDEELAAFQEVCWHRSLLLACFQL